MTIVQSRGGACAKKRLERIGKRLALRLDRDRPSAAEKSRTVLASSARRSGSAASSSPADPHELKRIFRIVDGTRDNFSCPLRDKPRIGSKDEIEKNMRRRTGEETVRFVVFDCDHLCSSP